MGKDSKAIGKFTIIIEEARLTRDTSSFLDMDPYMVVNHKDTKHKTKTAYSGGKHPKWEKEKLELYPEAEHDIIDIHLFDNGMLSDESIGSYQMLVN